MDQEASYNTLERDTLYSLPDDASVTLDDAASYFQCTKNRVGRMIRGEYLSVYLYSYKIGNQPWTTMGSIRLYQKEIMERQTNA